MAQIRVLRPVSFWLPLTLLSFAMFAIAGCGSSSSSSSSSSTPTVAQTIQGSVFGGQQPVAGAEIQLYVAGTPTSGGGYGQGAIALITAPLPKTNNYGAFTITGKYALPSAPSHFYIVATGGSPGYGNPVNPSIVLMSAISDCTATGTLSSSLFININEVTTMAAAVALQPFMAAPTGSVGAPVLIGAPATAYNDLRTAFKTSSTLASIASGGVVSPTSSNGPLLLTLADILAHCVNSNPSGDNHCAALFAAATPSGNTVAADTVQAAWYVAQNPTNSVPALFGLIPPSPPFVALSSAPASFAVSVPPTTLVSCFAVLGGSTVTNTGATAVSGGDLGLYPGTSVTGFPPGVVTAPATQHIADSVAANGQNNLTAAYNYAAGLSATGILPADVGTSTFTPGVYSNSGAVGLSGSMTLDAQNEASAVFIFQIGSTLTTASDTQILLVNGAQAKSIFWQVGTSASLGTNSKFAGSIMAAASITLGTGTTLQGRALASTAAVTLSGNAVTAP